MKTGGIHRTMFPNDKLATIKKVIPEVEWDFLFDSDLWNEVQVCTARVGNNLILAFGDGGVQIYPEGGPWKAIEGHNMETRMMKLRAILQDREGLL